MGQVLFTFGRLRSREVILTLLTVRFRANNDDVLSDTACLAVLRTSNLPRERRLPGSQVVNLSGAMIFLDFVAVGYQKCGTETLSFLDCHPNIVYR